MADERLSLILNLWLFTIIKVVNGYSYGAPEFVCSTMTPGHGTVQTSTSPPYSLTLSGSENLTVTISSTSTYKGFLLKATTENGPISETIGMFDTAPARTRRACSNKAMTHTDGADKVNNELTFTWIPPDNTCGYFVFVATIAETKQIIWKNIKSSRITIKCPTTTTSTTSTTTTTTTEPTTTTTTTTPKPTTTTSRTTTVSSTTTTTTSVPTTTTTTTTTPKPTTTTSTTTTVSSTTTTLPGTTTTKPTTTTLSSLTTTTTNPTAISSTTTTTPTTRATSQSTLDSSVTTTAKITTSTTPTTTTSTTTTTTSTTSSSVNVIKLDPACDDTIGCLSDCQNSKCTYLITWKNLPNDIEYVIEAKLSASGDQWAAIALSHDKSMGSDSVIACRTMNGIVSAEQFYNIDMAKYSQPIQNGKLGLTFLYGSVQDSIIRCRFQRKKIIQGEPRLFNLTEKWHILFGTGPLYSGNIGKHYTKPIASSSKVDFLSTEMVTGEKINYLMVKLHATFMLGAWMLFAGVGVVIARHFKERVVWFSIHRVMMVLALLCVIAGIVIIFVDVGGYSQIMPQGGMMYLKSHPILGLIVAALTLINPVMALFRPKPDSKNRFIFNWLHRFVGLSAMVLAVITIFFGLQLDKADMPLYAIYIMAAYCGAFIVIEIILECHLCTSSLRHASSSYELKSPGKTQSRVDESNKTSTWKTLVMILHVLSSVGFTTALIVLVHVSSSDDS